MFVNEVSPNGLRNTEGNYGTPTPFGVGSIRYQQVFASSEFSSVIPEGGIVQSIGFRVDGIDGFSFDNTLMDLQVSLSTTFRSPDELSLVYADNVGPDENVVFGPGNLHIRAGFTQNMPQSFQVFIVPEMPFRYDPRAGNLLVDIQASDLFDRPPFDAQESSEDGVSRVFGFRYEDSGFTADTRGLVTLFTFEPVPEPSSIALCAVGGLAWAGSRFFCRRHQAIKKGDS